MVRGDGQKGPAMNRQDLYTTVTNKIIAQLEAGVLPWSKPWSAGNAGANARPLRWNGQPYRGVNVLLLWLAAEGAGYTNPTWLTFKQALELGGHVRKGEKGTQIVFASKMVKEEERDGQTVERAISFLKSYTVFNVEQCDGLPERFQLPAPVATPESTMQRLQAAEAFFRNTGARISEVAGDRAFYRPSTDEIVVPAFVSFRDPQSYYSTLAHECTHWTLTAERCNRKFDGSKRFGGEAYAMEELVAELGAAFLCADLGIANEPREDHASYLASWLKALKADNRAIFTAATFATSACDYLHGLQPGAGVPVEAEGEEEAPAPAAPAQLGLQLA